jgi:hypothetical protein
MPQYDTGNCPGKPSPGDHFLIGPSGLPVCPNSFTPITTASSVLIVSIAYFHVTSPISAGMQILTPSSMQGIINGASYYCDTGENQELVTLIAVGSTTLTAVFAYDHEANTQFAGGPTTVSSVSYYWPGQVSSFSGSDDISYIGNIWILDPNAVPPAPVIYYTGALCVGTTGGLPVYWLTSIIEYFPVQITDAYRSDLPGITWGTYDETYESIDTPWGGLIFYSWLEQIRNFSTVNYFPLPAGRTGSAALNPALEINNLDLIDAIPFIAEAKYSALIPGLGFVYEFTDPVEDGVGVAYDGEFIGIEPIINFIAGQNIELAIEDVPEDEQIDVEITALTTVESAGTPVGTEKNINFIAGPNIGLTIADDPSYYRVDIGITGFVSVENSGSYVGTEEYINFIADQNISLNITNNPTNNRVDVAITGLVSVEDDGDDVGTEKNINFIADQNIELDITDDPDNARVDVAITGLVTVEDSGEEVGTEKNLNFIAEQNIDLTITDNPDDNRVDIKIEALTSVENNGSLVGTEPNINIINTCLSAIVVSVVNNTEDNRIDITIKDAAMEQVTIVESFNPSTCEVTDFTLCVPSAWINASCTDC